MVKAINLCMRELHLKMKLIMFVHYLKIIDTLLKKNDFLEANCLRNTKITFKILVGQAVLELLMKTCKILF